MQFLTSLFLVLISCHSANYLLLAKSLKLHAFAAMCEDFIAQNLLEVRELDSAYGRLDAVSLSHLLDKASAKAFISNNEAAFTDEIPDIAVTEAQQQELQQRGKVSQAKRRPRTDTETQIYAEKQRLAALRDGALEVATREELTARERAAFTGDEARKTLVKKFEKGFTRVESKEAEKEVGPEGLA